MCANVSTYAVTAKLTKATLIVTFSAVGSVRLLIQARIIAAVRELRVVACAYKATARTVLVVPRRIGAYAVTQGLKNGAWRRIRIDVCDIGCR